MKSLLIIIFISVCLSSMGLFCSDSYAANNQIAIQKTRMQANQSTQVKSSEFHLAGSLHQEQKSKASESNQLIKSDNNLFKNYADSPLLMLPNEMLYNIAIPLQHPKNKFFENFALFNDKLHSFLSYFTSAGKLKHMNESTTADANIVNHNTPATVSNNSLNSTDITTED